MPYAIREPVEFVSIAPKQSATKKTMLLLRCQYPYGKPQKWMPMDLMKLSAQLSRAGVDSTIVDLNIERMPDLKLFTHIGIGVIGAPYIPVSRSIVQSVADSSGKKIFVGGQGIEHFTQEQFTAIYGKSAIQIRSINDLKIELRIPVLPEVYDVTINQQVTLMDRAKLRMYLESEFSFFVSQGCKYGCKFCAAKKNMTEQFSTVMNADIDAISKMASEFGMKKLRIYITSLDAFQNPEGLKTALKTFKRAKADYGIEFEVRALSRIDSFLNAMNANPDLRELITSSGLRTIGFGVDGTTNEEWQTQHKANKSLGDAVAAFNICKSMGVTAEALMVMGFHDKDGKRVGTKDTIDKDVEFSIEQAEKNKVVSRPHLAKDMVPGSAGWESRTWKLQREQLLRNPELFVNLDFVALGSEITHPNEKFREEVNLGFLQIANTLGRMCTTNPLMPRTGIAGKDIEVDSYNRNVPFDK